MRCATIVDAGRCATCGVRGGCRTKYIGAHQRSPLLCAHGESAHQGEGCKVCSCKEWNDA